MDDKQDPVALAQKWRNVCLTTHKSKQWIATSDLAALIDLIGGLNTRLDWLEPAHLAVAKDLDAARAEVENLERQLHEAHRLHDDLRTSVANTRAEVAALQRRLAEYEDWPPSLGACDGCGATEHVVTDTASGMRHCEDGYGCCARAALDGSSQKR